MVLEPKRRLTVNTNIQEIHHHHYHHHHHHSNSQATMSDFIENESQEQQQYHHGYNEGHDDHTLSAEDLALKLHKLQQKQGRDDHLSYVPSHGHGRSEQGTPMVQIDASLQKRAQETIQEILERLERQKNEGDLQFQAMAVPGMEDNGHGRIRHTHRLNPNLLARDSSHAHTLTQSHGNANLRHS